MEVIIRPIQEEELESVLHLNSLLFHKEIEDYDPYLIVSRPYLDVGKEYFSSRMKEEKSLLLGAFVETTLIGYVAGSTYDAVSRRTVGDFVELENMLVLDAYRNQGVGKKLVTSVFERCKVRGIGSMQVIASAENKDAIRFYETCGCRQYATTLEIIL